MILIRKYLPTTIIIIIVVVVMIMMMFVIITVSCSKNSMTINNNNKSSTTNCIKQPKMLINLSIIDNNIINYGETFIDLKVGSNLTLTCISDVIVSEMLNNNNDNDSMTEISWILPEFHPVMLNRIEYSSFFIFLFYYIFIVL